MTATNETILKSDRLGRLRYSAEKKAAIVEAYQASGLSGPRFAAIHGVNYQTLASWLQKRKKTASPTDAKPAFLFLVSAEFSILSSSGVLMEILLPGGTGLAIITSG